MSTPLLFSPRPHPGRTPHTAIQSVVCNFTLTEFTKRKQFNNKYYSPSFYTHTHGYKMLLTVCANDLQIAKGTHISVYVSLMKGEYDNKLNYHRTITNYHRSCF